MKNCLIANSHIEHVHLLKVSFASFHNIVIALCNNTFPNCFCKHIVIAMMLKMFVIPWYTAQKCGTASAYPFLYYFLKKSSSHLHHMMTRSKLNIIFKSCGLDPAEPFPSETTTIRGSQQQ